VSGPNIQEKSDEAFVEAIQNGKGYMSSFPDLNDTDIGNIIAYVRSL
jgi:mono/diheme cytochrome c family protein